MTTIDMKKISVYNFLEIANAKWMINDYLKNISDVEVENFEFDEENQLTKSKEYLTLLSTINQKFSWK